MSPRRLCKERGKKAAFIVTRLSDRKREKREKKIHDVSGRGEPVCSVAVVHQFTC